MTEAEHHIEFQARIRFVSKLPRRFVIEIPAWETVIVRRICRICKKLA